MPLSFDPDGTKVVLICTTNCHLDSENLPPIPSVENNVRTLGKIFRRRDIIGLKGSCVTEIVDPSSSTNLLIQLSKLSKQATDTFCVYYAGHGIKSPFVSGLFLATTETTLEECHLNGVEFNKIRQIVFDSPAAKKLLLFDCCYSGEVATEEMGGAISNVLSSSLQIKGTYSIASTPRNSVA